EYRTSNEVLITSSLGVVLVDLSTGAVSPIYSTSSNESLVTIAPDVNGDRLFLLVLESSFSIKLLDMTTLSVSEVTTPSGAGFDSNLYFDEASEHLFMGEHSAIKEFDLAGNVIDRVIVPHQGFWLEWFDLGPTPGSYIFATGYPTQIGLYDPSSSNEASILVKAKAGISDVEFHRGEQSLYWRDQRRSEIARAFLSAPTDVEVLRHFTSGSSGARGLALDEANGFLYWNYSGVLRGLSFSLPSFDLVPPESPAQTYYGSSTCLLSFDKKRGAIAWAQYSNSESILFEQIPSSGEFSPILSGELRVTDIAVGPVSGKTYFLARDNNTSASFLGVFDPATGTLTTLFSDLHTSKGLTISDDEELIFWTDSSVRTVNMGSTEGGDVHELLRLPTGELEGITFALERVSP
ncbi:MAG: hypothetical protein KDD64_03125, partial [Bdellovibrionales bacterium]|nr:hypothetical protein [Bdellovibrionales bacterium]